MVDKTTSPLMDPNFIEQASAGQTLAEALSSDTGLVEQLAVSQREGNDLTNQGLGADLTNMSYGQLAAKYGESVAANRINIQKELTSQRQVQGAERTPGQILGDSVLSGAAGFVGMVGGGTAATLGVAGKVDQAFDESKTGLSELGVGVAGTTEDVTGFIRGFQSTELQDRQNLSSIEAQLDAQDSLDQYERDVQSGGSEFLASLSRVGRDTLNTGERILSDGAILGDTVAQALGSLGPSAKLAQAGQGLALGATNKFTRNEFAEKLARATGEIAPLSNGQRIASAVGVAAGVGVAEASGAYMDTANSVMTRTHEEMMTSPEYVAMIDRGIDPEQAKELLASSTALEAFGRQFPTAMALTMATGAGKFNASPAAAVRGNGIVDAFSEVGKQALEEGLQGSSAQLNQNIAIQNQVDEGQLLVDGVGEQLATGAIAGAGMAGALGVAQSPVTLAEPVINAGRTGVSAALDAAASTGQVIRDNVSNVSDTVATKAPAVGEALETIKNAGTQTLQRVQDFAESSDLTRQVRDSALAKSIEIQASNFVSQADEAGIPGALAEVATNVKESVVPADLADSIPSTGTVIENVSNLIQSFAQPNKNLSRLSESALLFASENFEALKAASNDLPAEIKAGVAKIISSPDFQKVRKLASKIDLNTSQTAETEVNVDTVNDTIRVAKTNPTNVNPEFVNKILEQPAGTVSPEEVNLLRAASSIAQAVNNHAGQQVVISNNERVALSQKPAYQANPERLDQNKPEMKIEDTSRSIQVAGFKGLRSVNDFAADIFKGGQSPDGTFVNDEGVSVPVGEVANQFKMFAQHMANKVDALNRSAANADDKGNGTPEYFTSLVGGRRMAAPGEAGNAKPVTYRAGSEKAVKFAQEVENDARVTAEVYNTLVRTFPDLFPAGEIEIPTLNVETKSDAEQTPQKETEATDDQKQEDTKTTEEESVSDDTTVETQEDVAPELPEGLDKGTPGKEQTLQLYHGTSSRFDKFDINKAGQNLQDDSGIFFTNDFDLAKQYSIFSRGNANDRHVIEAAVTLESPLEFNSEAKETDQFWINNKDALQALVSDGNHDGAIIRNDKGEITVVTLKPENIEILTQDAVKDQPVTREEDTTAVEVNEETSDAQAEEVTEEPITDEENNAVDEVFDDVITYDLPEIFQNSFVPGNGETTYEDGNQLIDAVENTGFKSIAKALMRPLTVRMNQRLKTTKFDKTMTVAEALVSDSVDPTAFRDYKNTIFVNPETLQYDPALLSLAAASVIDWMSGARATDPSRLQDTLEDLGVNYEDLSDADMDNIINGVSPREAAESIARSVLKTWNLKASPDAAMIDTRGAVESLVKELLTVSADMGLIELNDIPYRVNGELRTAQTINITRLRKMHEKIGLEGQNSIAKMLVPEEVNTPSIGNKLPSTDQSQSRGNVPLSSIEKKALKAMQDTAHFISEGVSGFVSALGFDALNIILGFREVDGLGERHPLRASIVGKNLSIERDYADAMAVVDAIQAQNSDEQVPVYYPVGISKVGRHQFKGINPQNNKILRAMVTPTHSTLDMTNQENRDAFWLTVSQAADLRKVENESHAEILSEIEGQFNERFGEATDLALGWVKTGQLDSLAFAEAMGTAGMAEVSAVITVAQYRFALENGTEGEFQTSLSFELDGKTDGPANMMSNFGQGELTNADYENFKRVGFFLGSKEMTLNNHFTGEDSTGDLYEVTSSTAQAEMVARIAKAKPEDKAALIAVRNFSAAFGDLKIKDGQYEMTRSTSKSPMTKTVYGSGVRGVAAGIAQDMVLEFYERMITVPAGQDPASFLGYPTLAEDFQTIFGEPMPKNINWADSYMDRESMKRFEDIVTKGMGDILSSTAKNVIGDKITAVNDALVFLTGVQTEFLQNLFQRRLEELAEKRAAEGKIGRNKQGKAIITQLSNRDYNNLVRELSAYAPVYSNGGQTLAVGSFENQPSDYELSSNMDGKLRMKSNMQSPAPSGVKVIPYLSIGRGDAMMMNTIYGSDNAPTDTLPVFDGIDMPVSRVKDYANQINEAVMQNWDRDVLADVEADFNKFLSSVGSDTDLLEAAFAATKENTQNTTVTANSAQELLETVQEMHRQNQARKAAFKRIPLSVDHMGGSDSAYTRGDDVQMGLAEINSLIREQLSGNADAVVEETTDVGMEQEVEPDAVEGEFSKVTAAPATVMIDALIQEIKVPELRKVLKALRTQMKSSSKVVTGTLAQVQAYRAENYPTDGQALVDANGMYDAVNDVIYIVNNNPETITHELVHMVTFNNVLAHYEGARDDAVVRLEGLMEEFMEMDFSNESNELSGAANRAMASIIQNQNSDTAMSKAVALNEFMAWTLSNQELINKLKSTQTKTLTDKVIALITRIIGGAAPRDMFSNILFNASVLGQDTENGGDNGNSDNGDGEVTGTAEQFTNFWLDLVRKRIDQSKVATGEGKRNQLSRYTKTAQSLVRDLDFGGFNLSEYQKQTFMAIHVVLATEMRLDPRSSVAIQKLFDHVTTNLSPSMFGKVNAEERYQTVMDMFGNTSNDQDVSDAIAVFLALSQTSNGFRSALENIPAPEAAINDGTLNSFLEEITATLMNKALGSIDVADKSAVEILDGLNESLIRQEGDREYALLKGLMSNINKANKATAGAMDKLAGRINEFDRKLKESDANQIAKLASGSVALASNFLSEDRTKLAAQGLKNATHMGVALDKFVPIREFISEVVGTDAINAGVVALLDRTNYAVSSVRQAFREDLPNVLAKAFQNKPTPDQWKTMHSILGKTDFAAIFDLNNPDASMRLMVSESRLNKRIEAAEKAIIANFSKPAADAILEKTQQLANFMNGNGAGHQLWKNAYAINRLAGEFDSNMTSEIDSLVSLYALQGQDSAMKAEVVDLYNADPEGVTNLVVYMQGLNKQEEMKVDMGLVSEEALLNGYKGYIPDQGSGGAQLIIADDTNEEMMVKKGFVRVADAPAELNFSSNSRGYYTTTVKQGGMYSQGVLQSVQASYRGVDSNTGLTVNGTTSGVISDAASIDVITDELNAQGYVEDDKEVLIPVQSLDGITHYERAINPDLTQMYTAPKSNLALMLGAWAGRQAEEEFARQYNTELIGSLKDIYDNREPGSDGLFVDLSNTNDAVFNDSWNVISPETKKVIEDIFGEDGGFMVRKDMVNLALGYREASILDVWTGKTRMPEAVQTTVKATAKALLGDKAAARMSQLEEGIQGVVSAAKDIIVVKSLVVPFMNAQANMVQLATRGVGVKSIIRGTRDKLTEIEQYNENVTKVIELNARIQLAGTDKNKVAILQSQRQAIWDQNARMSIAPMITAGAYKNISEGITDMDVEITGGRLGDFVDAQVNKLPGKLQTAAKYALVSKDTPIYKAANKSVQYGDFIAKAIYYDHLIANGKTHDEAIQEVNEEFVNFSVLPGRTRSYIESMGGSWFLTFKIRIMKIALKTLQNNPFGALITSQMFDVGSPIEDNLLSVTADDRLDYSLGTDMLFGAPDLNPWVNLIDWAGE